MDQLRDYADDRLINGCIYCGADAFTRDHVPSRILLDKPYPTNLPVVGACRECNGGFSQDEEYVACAIEALRVGSTDPKRITRPSIANCFARSPALRLMIDTATTVSEDRTVLQIDQKRFLNVMLKLARGHAAFELSQPCRGEPTLVRWGILSTMNQSERDDFDAAHVCEVIGEVGSRGLQRTYVVEAVLLGGSSEKRLAGLLVTDWVDVQEDIYRYLAMEESDCINVKLVISELFACEVVWSL